MQIAALPYSGEQHADADMMLKLPSACVRKTAVQLVASRRGAGSGCTGCDCRAALGEALVHPVR